MIQFVLENQKAIRGRNAMEGMQSRWKTNSEAIGDHSIRDTRRVEISKLSMLQYVSGTANRQAQLSSWTSTDQRVITMYHCVSSCLGLNLHLPPPGK